MDEKLRILKMTEDGEITAKQALKMLEDLQPEKSAVNFEKRTISDKDYDMKLFRIVVDSSAGDKVNIRFPVGAVKRVLKATDKLPVPDGTFDGVDVSELMKAVRQCLEAKVEGDFVNIDAANGTKVRIYTE